MISAFGVDHGGSVAKYEKNISQRQTEAAQGRRSMRRGSSITGLGVASAYLGSSPQGIKRVADLKYVPDNAKMHYQVGRTLQVSRTKSATRATGLSAKSIARTAVKNPLLSGGLGAMAVGTGMMAHGTFKRRHAEQKIGQLRRKRAT